MNLKLKLILSSLCFSLLALCAEGQVAKKELHEGDNAYVQGNYALADSLYRVGSANGAPKGITEFNRGNALYQRGLYDEALSSYRAAEKNTDESSEKAEALHNIGNTYLQQEKFGEAVDAYKKSLRLNPSDEDTRYNLAYAQQLMQQQQEQEQENQDNQDGDQDEEGDQDKKQENQKGDQEQEGEQEGDQEGDEEKEGEQEKENDQQKEGEQQGEEEKEGEQKPFQISKDDAQRMLEALDQKEKALQLKLQQEKGKGEKKKIEKDW